MNSTRVDLRDYIVTSVWFGCNNDCSICMLSGMRDQLPPLGFDRYRKLLQDIVKSGNFRNLILSGSEVTSFADLESYIKYAASLNWFEKIQIQTNGRRLSDVDYLSRLVECGVNEFFVSIHGTRDVHDGIAGVRGAFDETIAGLQNLSGFEVNVITNTVLTRLNTGCIQELMGLIVEKPVSEIHMWNYFPMSDRDEDDLIINLRQLSNLVDEVTAVTIPAQKPLVLKAFPECLVFEGAVIDSGYPETVLPNAFWEKFGECGFGTCVYREECSSKECWGLCRAYIGKYGNEKELLKPFQD